MLNDEQYIDILVRLFSGGLAAAFAIAAWAKSSEGAWLLAVLGIISLYAQTICYVLELLGFFPGLLPYGLSRLIRTAFSVLPPLFFTAASIAIIIKRARF